MIDLKRGPVFSIALPLFPILGLSSIPIIRCNEIERYPLSNRVKKDKVFIIDCDI